MIIGGSNISIDDPKPARSATASSERRTGNHPVAVQLGILNVARLGTEWKP
jgi:hypothetical protein